MDRTAAVTGEGRPRPGRSVLPLDQARSIALARGERWRVVSRRDPRDAFLSVSGGPADFSALRPGQRVVVTQRRSSVLLSAFEPATERLISDSVEGALGRLDRGDVHAAILPGAAVVDAGRESDIAEWLHQTSWIPAPARGFLAEVGTEFGEVDDTGLLGALVAEETLAARLESAGGRSAAAVGAIAIPFGDYLRLWAMVVSADGGRALRVNRTGRQDSPVELGREVAEEMLDRGGRVILEVDE